MPFSSADHGDLVDVVDRVMAAGAAAGLDAVGVADAAPFESTLRDLEERKAAGLAAGMQFTYRNPARSTDPSRALPGARALVVGARSYHRRPPTRPTHQPAGRVACYAWDDYYGELRVGLDAVAATLRRDGWRTRVLVDDNGLVDREAARRAGIGWYGKNTNILLPGRGSWFVLGSVVTDAPLPPTADEAADGCGPCTRCLDACPTGAIVAPGVVDARRCLAWLVQAEGDFPLEHRAALGDRIYGCDDCQEVCPPNRVTERRTEVDAGGPPPGKANAWVPLLDLLAADDVTLIDRHGRWYIPRRDPRYLRRNALVALGNVGTASDPATTATVERYRRHDDAMLREHAEWAAQRISARA